MEKFHKVWNQEVTWNDELYPCLNRFIKFTITWDVNQTLQPISNNSTYTHEHKLEGFMLSKWPENASIDQKE